MNADLLPFLLLLLTQFANTNKRSKMYQKQCQTDSDCDFARSTCAPTKRGNKCDCLKAHKFIQDCEDGPKPELECVYSDESEVGCVPRNHFTHKNMLGNYVDGNWLGEHCGGNISSNMGCNSKLVCNYTFDSNDPAMVCRCPDRKPNWVPETRDCIGNAVGGDCDVGRLDCIEGLPCIEDLFTGDGKCGCETKTPVWNVERKRCQKKSFGDPCDDPDYGCGGEDEELYCDNVSLTCICKPVRPNWDPDKQMCDKKYSGQPCTPFQKECYWPLSCQIKHGFCTCPHYSPHWNVTSKTCGPRPTHGQHCHKDEEQLCSPRSVDCILDICSCAIGREFKDGRCVAKKWKTLNGGCTAIDDCNLNQNLTCNNGKCVCAPGHDWVLGTCLLKGNGKKCNPEKIPNECHEKPLENLECDENLNVCNCPKHMEFSLPAKSCKLKSGQPCFYYGRSEHSLCASQHCDDTTKTCVCPEKDGRNQIWSSEPGEGCVDDLYFAPCNELNGYAECRGATLSKSRNKLFCMENQCQCSKPYHYYNGYCVFIPDGYESACDQNAIDSGDVCNMTGKGLTCKSKEDGNSKCLCLPKEVSYRRKPVVTTYVSLTWDSVNLTCDLKRTGRCQENYECQTGICTNFECGTEIVIKSKSSITNLNTLIVLVIFFGQLIHHFLY